VDEVYLKQTALTAFPVSPKALRFSESQVDTNKRNASVGTMICCCAPPLQAGKK
jgi:competence protein ComGC